MNYLLLFLLLGQLYFVDAPTAGILSHGEYSIGLEFQAEGGMLGQVGVGFFDRFNFGLSYGGLKVLGRGSPDLYPHPEFQGKLLLWPDYGYYPGVALGFDSQGLGQYQDGRYELKSKGFYLVVGKVLYSVVGETELAVGLNYSLEGDKKLDGFAGIAQSLGPDFSIILDYDRARDDPITQGRGYLNLGWRWRFMGTVAVGLDFKDLLENAGEGVSRTASLSYRDWF